MSGKFSVSGLRIDLDYDHMTWKSIMIIHSLVEVTVPSLVTYKHMVYKLVMILVASNE